MTYVLSLCDRTGNMVKPWVDAGYHAITIDIQDPQNKMPNREHMKIDVRDFNFSMINKKPCFVFAFPPCTHLASSGARWFKNKGKDALIDALDLVKVCHEIAKNSNAPWCIENPVGRLSTYWRKPDYIFHPFHYAGYSPKPEQDAYTKKTCLWVGNGFIMPDYKSVEPILGSKMHKLPPSKDRSNLRSITPIGFAYAVFSANEQLVKMVK